MNPKITPEHLSRQAVIYLRQSNPDQVRNNLESQRRQYALADKARELGWDDVQVIDEDLGRSGASSSNRTGFVKLVGAVSMKEVGAVFSLEASRLARNNRDWSHLIDLCSLVGTLIIDHDGVYDPQILNDRLLLGLKGTMSEFELGLIRQRCQEALSAMVQRGELFTILPIGYVRTHDNRCEKNPDQRIQEAISLVFDTFQETLSIRQTLLWLRQEQILLPSQTQSAQETKVEWKLPGYNTVRSILTNPVYAGVYAYGKTRTFTQVVDGRARKVRGYAVPREEWQVFIPDHHEGYVSLDTFEKNQSQIRENARKRPDAEKGPIRGGKGLVAGLLRCQRCGRKLHVSYSGKGGKVVRYSCRGAALNHGTDRCISFGGTAVDREMEQEILRALDHESILASLEQEQKAQTQHEDKRRALEFALEQAEYESQRAFRQYDAVEPENRLVARELEERWNQALAEENRIREQLEAAPEHPGELTSEQEELLFSLAVDFHQVWFSEHADMALKKRLTRLLIQEILVDVEEEKGLVHLTVLWSGGCHTRLVVKKNRTGQHTHSTSKATVDLIRDLARVSRDQDIVRILNRLGVKTASGMTWTEARVRSVRTYYRIPAYSWETKRREGWFNLSEASGYLGVSPMSVLRLVKAGRLKAEQAATYAPWVLCQEDLDAPETLEMVRQIKDREKRDKTGPAEGQTCLEVPEMFPLPENARAENP